MKKYVSYIGPVILAMSFIGAISTGGSVVLAAEPFGIHIETTNETIQGGHEYVNVFVTEGSEPVGGFDFLIAYDASALTFVGADSGSIFARCDWEYFAYRYGANGNCTSGCPSGLLRVTGIAEINNGPNHPNCFLMETGDTFVTLDFLVSNDHTLQCQFVPIRFFWFDCGDNTLSSQIGDSLFISKFVYDYTSGLDLSNPSVGYPTCQGAQDADCFGGKPNKVPVRIVNFYNGGIDIACTDVPDIRGDINLDGVPADTADFYLFTEYFMDGLSAFVINLDQQLLATDVNRDGDNLTIADLIYLARIIENNGNPPPLLYDTSLHTARFIQHFDLKTIEVETPDTLGAVRLVFNDSILPAPLEYPMELIYQYDGHQTRVLIVSLDGETIPDGVIMNYSGNAALIVAETAGHSGTRKIDSRIDRVTSVISQPESTLPLQFSLDQNYPNPFNPVTTISFQLPLAVMYQLDIFNVAGQKVTSFAGNASAGTSEISWDATGMASGVYYYRLTAGEFTDTKNMLLLK